MLKILTCLLLLFVYSCKKEPNDSLEKNYSIEGKSQKGPFLNGSSLSLFEMHQNFSMTGKVYHTQLLDNSGYFEVSNISLISPFVLLKADGFYFNEVTGIPSKSQITLYGYSDITNKNLVNVNVITHLEKSRIEYLMNTGLSFVLAKKQAEQEILQIFSIQKPNIAESELLNISQSGDDHAILLAISVILQGYRSEAELSALMSDISSDIRTDGVLNSATIGTSLINDAKLLNLSQIRSNLEQRYNQLGLSVNIPNFENYILQFINQTNYTFNKFITYPEVGKYGLNVLNQDSTNFKFFEKYSFLADLPIGTSLKIKIKNGLWWYSELPDAPENWNISSYENETQTFTAIESGKQSELKITFDQGTHLIEFYENNDSFPTKTKTITVY